MDTATGCETGSGPGRDILVNSSYGVIILVVIIMIIIIIIMRLIFITMRLIVITISIILI